MPVADAPERLMLMPPKIYAGVYAASFAVVLFAFFWLAWWLAAGAWAENQQRAWRIGGYAVGQFAVVHSIFNLVLLNRMWQAIQDGQTSITTRRAIGLSFVPVFNFYWLFRQWAGYPAEFNRYVERYDLPVKRLSNRWFIAYPVSILLAAFLLLPLAVVPIVFLIVSAKANRHVSRLDEAVQKRRDELANGGDFEPTKN